MMKKTNLEHIIRDLRIQSMSHKSDVHLEQLLATHDRWYQTRIKRNRSRRLRYTWAATLTIAVTIILMIYLAVTFNLPNSMTTDKRQTMAVPLVGIVTTDSLQTAFYQGGLDGLERQLDQAFKLRGPGPVDLTTQDLY